jgi:uncharacterized damage-inducible protein DinB
MMARKTAPTEPFDVPDALVRAWEINDRINAYLIDGLDERAWRADPPDGKGRTIAAIAAHMHNVRVMWLKMVKAADVPAQVERTKVTRKQAVAALEESTNALARVLRDALEAGGRVRGFKPDVAAFFGYLIAHDAHHRGQIAMLARQVGFPISQQVTFGMWEWGKR